MRPMRRHWRPETHLCQLWGQRDMSQRDSGLPPIDGYSQACSVPHAEIVPGIRRMPPHTPETSLTCTGFGAPGWLVSGVQRASLLVAPMDEPVL